MTDSKLLWFFTGGICALSLVIIWNSYKGASKTTRKKLEEPTYRKVKDLISEADELLDILREMDKIK